MPATVYLPKKWQQTTDTSRLEKRRCQLNHYFAELGGWANREGVDLWDPSVSEAFAAFIRELDDGAEDDRSSLRSSDNPSSMVDPQGVGGSAQRDGNGGSDAALSPVAAAESWDDSYLTMRSQRTRESLVPQPPARLGSFAFGVSQSKPSDSSNSSGGGGVAPPTEVATGSPREVSGQNPLTASPPLEALRESESELGGALLCCSVPCWSQLLLGLDQPHRGYID